MGLTSVYVFYTNNFVLSKFVSTITFKMNNHYFCLHIFYIKISMDLKKKHVCRCLISVIAETNPSSLLYYLIIVFGIVLIIFAVIVVILCIKFRKKLKQCLRKQSQKSCHSSKTSISNNKVGSLDTIRSNHIKLQKLKELPTIQPMVKMELLYKNGLHSRTGIGSRDSFGSTVSINSAFHLNVK